MDMHLASLFFLDKVFRVFELLNFYAKFSWWYLFKLTFLQDPLERVVSFFNKFYVYELSRKKTNIESFL